MAGYQVKVTIEGARPPMWRRLLLPDRMSFGDLHTTLQIAFGWEEEHMHDFSFQHSRETVGNKENDDYVDLDEKDTAADNYLKDGWIRYTYDYGDDWRHKIVLEKELEDYENRYPQVIKYKGNNFEEDSGGVWGGEEVAEEYDPEGVNERLKRYCVCEPIEPAAGEGDFFDLREADKILKKLSGNLKKAAQKQSAPGKNKKSALDLKLEKIHDFYEKARQEQKTETEIKPEGQLVFDFDTGKTETEPESPDYIFIKGDRDVTQSELLEQGTQQLLLDYEKYLMLPLKEKRSKEEAKEAVLTALQENPSWYLILFDEETVKNFRICAEAGPGERLPDLAEKSVAPLCSWGLLDVRVLKINRKTAMAVSAAKGAEAFLHFLETARLPQFYGTKKQITDGISYLMMSYGLMELPALHAKYQKAFGPISYEELMRYLYLHGRMYGYYTTGEGMVNGVPVSIAAVMDLDMNVIFAQMNHYAAELDYASFKTRRLLKWKEGISGFVPEWEELAQLLEGLEVVWEEELNELMPKLYQLILSGIGLDEMLYFMEEVFFEEPEEPESKLALTMIWMGMAECWLETPIACLKGHSRMEVSRLRNEEPFLVAVDEETDVLPEDLDGGEQIYELPFKMQQDLFFLLKLPCDKKGKERTRKELQKIKEEAGISIEALDLFEKLLLFKGKG